METLGSSGSALVRRGRLQPARRPPSHKLLRTEPQSDIDIYLQARADPILDPGALPTVMSYRENRR